MTAHGGVEEMSRIVVLHPRPAEVETPVEGLRTAGHDVRTMWPTGMPHLVSLRRKPPDAFVIDLGHQPSHGQALATAFRQLKATRAVPIVFIEGDEAKTAGVKQLLPDATYTSWRGVQGAVKSALSRPPEKPVVPGTMAAYSGTPLPKKLGIKAGSKVALLGAPKGFGATLGKLPEGAALQHGARTPANVILLFVRSRADLEERFPPAARAMADPAALWIVWPKKASALAPDLGANEVRAFGLDAGLVDYKIAAIDETWSGLCFARRKARGGG
jgi:CheY-like chemotaxis protein